MAIEVIPEMDRHRYVCTWFVEEDGGMTCKQTAFYSIHKRRYAYCKEHGELLINRFPKHQRMLAKKRLLKQGVKV